MGHVIDHAVPRIDGGHLAELWSMRQPFYPPDRIDLMERFIVDALKAGSRAAEGHRVVDRYEMETRLPLVRCPTLVIAPTADPHAHPHAPKVAAAIAGSRSNKVLYLCRIRNQGNSLRSFTASSPRSPFGQLLKQSAPHRPYRARSLNRTVCCVRKRKPVHHCDHFTKILVPVLHFSLYGRSIGWFDKCGPGMALTLFGTAPSSQWARPF